MAQLTSCYFCGDAMDASLEEYPVVPASLHPPDDDQQTVVLCGSCKRKLDAVIDSIAGAVEKPTDTSNANANDSTGASGPSNGGSGPSDIESTLGDDEDVLQPLGSEDAGSDSPGQSAGGQRSNGDGGRTADASGERDGGQQGESGSSASDRNRSSSKRDASDDKPKYTSSRRAGHDRTSVDDPPDDDNANKNRQSRNGGSDGGGSQNGGTDDAGTQKGGSDGGPNPDVTLTRLENTNVMRLLQNREFPVDRDDFVTVASSAYEISPSDCDKVIDLAIEHDLLTERNGQLDADVHWG